MMTISYVIHDLSTLFISVANLPSVLHIPPNEEGC